MTVNMIVRKPRHGQIKSGEGRRGIPRDRRQTPIATAPNPTAHRITAMPTKYFVEIGRVALVNSGPEKGKTCTIVDVIDQNRALVDGPETGVRRHAMEFKRMRLTKFKLRIPNGTSTKTVKKAWQKDEISKKFAETTMAKRMASQKKKEDMTDFDRFKLYKTKQRLNKIVEQKFQRLKAKTKREAPKPVKTPKKKDKKPKKRVKKEKKK